MAGRRESIAPLWKELQKELSLDLPTELNGGTDLGQIQKDVTVPEDVVFEQNIIGRNCSKTTVWAYMTRKLMVPPARQALKLLDTVPPRKPTRKRKRKIHCRIATFHSCWIFIGSVESLIKTMLSLEQNQNQKANENAQKVRADISNVTPVRQQNDAKGWQYDMCGHTRGCVEYYCQVADVTPNFL